MRRWIGLFLIWTIPLLLFTTNNYLERYDKGEDVAWLGIFLYKLPSWYLWALLTPLICKLANRFPFEEGKVVRQLLIHLGLGVATCFFYQVINQMYQSLYHGNPGQYFHYLFNRINGKLIWSMQIYLIVVAVANIIRYYRKSKELDMQAANLALRNSELENELSGAHLRALQMQMHPHFLFNALHSIGSLVRIHENDAAIRMIQKLANFLRYSLESEDSTWVTLENELAFIEEYLSIEKIRFQDKLQVGINVPDNLKDALVPQLVLQPIIENALKHGISKKKDARRLELNVRQDDGQLVITVFNEGPALTADPQKCLTSSVGLSNLNQRLRTHFGENYRLELSNGSNGGVTCLVSLPFKTASEDVNPSSQESRET